MEVAGISQRDTSAEHERYMMDPGKHLQPSQALWFVSVCARGAATDCEGFVHKNRREIWRGSQLIVVKMPMFMNIKF